MGSASMRDSALDPFGRGESTHEQGVQVLIVNSSRFQNALSKVHAMRILLQAKK